MIVHDLKCWPPPFGCVRCGVKTHEVRKADRDYSAGDMLVLREWMPPKWQTSPDREGGIEEAEAAGEYTGQVEIVTVTYVTHADEKGPWSDGISGGWCVLSIKRIEPGMSEEIR